MSGAATAATATAATAAAAVTSAVVAATAAAELDAAKGTHEPGSDSQKYSQETASSTNKEDSATYSSHEEAGISLLITQDQLDTAHAIAAVRSPAAGATVVFVGTTRDNFNSRTVLALSYSSYVPRAMRTLLAIARDMKAKHGLNSIAIQHRLGPVAIEEESIVIAISTAHRGAAWKAGEETLELCKDRVEIWKLEKLAGDDGEGTYKANRDGKMGKRVD